MKRALVATSLCLLSATVAVAQDAPAPLPAGHPPTPSREAPPEGLPSGHPAVPPGRALAPAEPGLPPGHPPMPAGEAPSAEGQLPPGHPPMPGQSAQGQLPAGHPAVPGEQEAGSLPPGHPPMQGGGPDVRAVLSPARLATADPSADVPAGTIRVTVVDPEGAPVAEAAVDVGTLAQGGDRQRMNARTDASGVALFEGLATGSGQAYRVNVPYSGATYSSTPFQLPPDRGYEVRITRLPVTRDDRYVFFHVFRVIAELRDDRLHIIHQAELTNAGRETYVFPASGRRGGLPEGALAFQAQRVMTDQRVEEESGGYVIRGSLPPGTVQLAWAYDLPVDGDTVRIPVDVPLRFFGLQVFSEAPEGLVMNVRGLPSPQRVDNDGQPIWLTQVTRGPDEAPIEHFTVTLSGIPGPGPGRWVAVMLAALLVLGGVLLTFMRADDSEAGARARRRRREEILAAIRELELDYESGEVGPEFRQSRRADLVRALAVLLHEEEAAKQKEASRAPAAKPAGRPAR